MADAPYTRDIPELKASVNHSYFYMPPVWIGDAPTGGEMNALLQSLVRIVCSRQLSMGIRIDAHRDGVFLFDFTCWPEGKPINIPAHTIVDGRPVPEPVIKAQREAEDHSYKCMSVMNAHLMSAKGLNSSNMELAIAMQHSMRSSAASASRLGAEIGYLPPSPCAKASRHTGAKGLFPVRHLPDRSRR